MNGNISLNRIHPSILNRSCDFCLVCVSWTSKCIITSKNDGGKSLSNSQGVTSTLFSRCSNWLLFKTLEHKCLKKLHNLTIAMDTFLSKTPSLKVGEVVEREYDNHETLIQIAFFHSLVCTERYLKHNHLKPSLISKFMKFIFPIWS